MEQACLAHSRLPVSALAGDPPAPFSPTLPAPALPPALHRDIEDKPRFLVGVQVDVTEHPTATEATPVGMQAASVVGQALQNMNW